MQSFFCIRKSGEEQYKTYLFSDESDIQLSFQPFDASQKAVILNMSESELTLNDLKREGLDLAKYGGSSSSHSKSEYEILVQKAKENIVSGKSEKIVVSRFVTADYSISVIDLYEKLLATYQNANIYMVNHPELGCWVGTTPEVLVSIEKDQLKTMSLAGTKKANAEWTDKEIGEQSLVTDYILEVLKSEGCTSIKTDGPKTVSAGPVHHLRTSINAKLIPESRKTILQKLHPTPAVCGIPLKESMNFILRNEGYDRSFYTGFIAIQQKDKVDAYVNLRCLQAFENKLKLYAGGGIVKDSNPEKEWLETESKMETLLSVIS